MPKARLGAASAGSIADSDEHAARAAAKSQTIGEARMVELLKGLTRSLGRSAPSG
jgi:hypothetical protein